MVVTMYPETDQPWGLFSVHNNFSLTFPSSQTFPLYHHGSFHGLPLSQKDIQLLYHGVRHRLQCGYWLQCCHLQELKENLWFSIYSTSSHTFTLISAGLFLMFLLFSLTHSSLPVQHFAHSSLCFPGGAAIITCHSHVLRWVGWSQLMISPVLKCRLLNYSFHVDRNVPATSIFFAFFVMFFFLQNRGV